LASLVLVPVTLISTGLTHYLLKSSEKFQLAGFSVVILIDGEKCLIGLLLVDSGRIVHHLKNVVEKVGQLASVQSS
jgi:hypothetical protein